MQKCDAFDLVNKNAELEPSETEALFCGKLQITQNYLLLKQNNCYFCRTEKAHPSGEKASRHSINHVYCPTPSSGEDWGS